MTYYFMGRCYLKLGERDKAISYLQAVLNANDESKYTLLIKLQLEKLSKK
jgi:tetratricopeptide (TPR) repeat protein